MDHQPPNLTVIPGGMDSGAVKRVGEIHSPGKPPGGLTTQERRVWDYICSQLRAAGIEHTTFGVAAMVVCKTYIQWIKAQAELERVMSENDGSYMVTTPNGFAQPHQIYYVAREMKKELLQWLPECCLTIPSLTKARATLGDAGRQDDLFGDLVGHANADRSAYSRS